MEHFRITGLAPGRFAPLFDKTDVELAAAGALRYRVDETPGFPDRVELRDLDIGESALLINFEHQPAATPFRARHAIFVREGANERYDRIDELPRVLRTRHLSLRAFDAGGMMVGAQLVDGTAAEAGIEALLRRADTESIHVHFAARGCYAALVTRAPVA